MGIRFPSWLSSCTSCNVGLIVNFGIAPRKIKTPLIQTKGREALLVVPPLFAVHKFHTLLHFTKLRHSLRYTDHHLLRLITVAFPDPAPESIQSERRYHPFTYRWLSKSSLIRLTILVRCGCVIRILPNTRGIRQTSAKRVKRQTLRIIDA